MKQKRPVSVEHILLDERKALVVQINFPDESAERRVFCMEEGLLMREVGGNIVDHVNRECPMCGYRIMLQGIHHPVMELTA